MINEERSEVLQTFPNPIQIHLILTLGACLGFLRDNLQTLIQYILIVQSKYKKKKNIPKLHL